MVDFSDIEPGVRLKGLHPDFAVEVIRADWSGEDAIVVFYRTPDGMLLEQLLYEEDLAELEVVAAESRWSFRADAELFKLASEAYRIELAHLFDEHLAVHTSLVEPLPHQITAVYGDMLPRQPLRFVLADDPGAGKTIMAGLLIKELMIRGDVRRCLVVCPGGLVEQWQDELSQKFNLAFEILTRDKARASRSGNWFLENPLAICRIDQIARAEDLKAQLASTEWDLVIVDEAHKMSAQTWGGDTKYTKRYELGQMLSGLTRHFLLMTATPHNGKEEDFQLFLALLDPDRFEGKFRSDIHRVDPSDLMRRMVKEELLRFDGTPLFPERRAYTVEYELTDIERELYEEVTTYVRTEFNRAEQIGGTRRGTVGFALTVLQRRLASSPEAIYQSLTRRKKRLEARLEDARLFEKDPEALAEHLRRQGRLDELARFYDPDKIEELFDTPEEITAEEMERLEDYVMDQATTAMTIGELEAEIKTLERLIKLASEVRHRRRDRKWDELSSLLQDNPLMMDSSGARRKLVIFTEHRDTLDYLHRNIETLIGNPDAIVTIHGGTPRDKRRENEHNFKNNPDVHILLATDAAGEGINLQRAHLMVNYDLPWNPNRLEQRFGRIHRIGQTEVCHLWNLVAKETREGDVFTRLFEKLEVAREALGGKVFDVLGNVRFSDEPLRDLLMRAIRYGDSPEVRAKLFEAVDQALDTDQLRELVEDQALAQETMDIVRVQEIRDQMDRMEARKLQPFYVAGFFEKAFGYLGGQLRMREKARYQIPNVPSKVRNRTLHQFGARSIARKYERVTFDKNEINLPGRPPAEFLSPGHPLLDTVVTMTLEQGMDTLAEGAVLVDPRPGANPRVLVYLEHSITDASTNSAGVPTVVSKRMQFVEIFEDGAIRPAGPAPYLDLEPAKAEDLHKLEDLLSASWVRRGVEKSAHDYAQRILAREHLDEIRGPRQALIDKTRRAVHARLTQEVIYWNQRAAEFRRAHEAGKVPKITPENALRRAQELEGRLEARMEELKRQEKLASRSPVIKSAALIVPKAVLEAPGGELTPEQIVDVEARDRVELLAIEAVLEAERELGYEPLDVGHENRGYDIESRNIHTGRLRFIEVKGRAKGATTVTVTRNEMLVGFNKPENYILALVEVSDDIASEPRYVRSPFDREPGFDEVSVNFDLKKLLKRADSPVQSELARQYIENLR